MKYKGYKDFTKEEQENIVKLYKENGLSTVKIGKQYGVTHKVISRVLDLYGINRVGNGQRKYFLNEHYFDEIDTPEKAYILGFFYADGSNNISKQTVSMSLQEEDKNVLEQIRLNIGSERPLEFLDYSNKHDFGYSYKNQYRLLIFSKCICNQLNNLGMTPNKSLTLEFPNWLNPELYSHFIRGYFDGDGSYCAYYTKSQKFQPLLTFTSTESFCKKIQEILIDKLDIPGGNIYDASCNNGITKVLSISGAIQVKKILDWLYKDSTIFLQRKFDKYYSSFYVNNSVSA